MDETAALRTGLAVWLIYAVVIGTIVAVQPDRRTVTLEYRGAAANWVEGEKALYRPRNGFLYLPHFALLYVPYQALPAPVGEPLWRWTGLALLAWGLWRVCASLEPGARGRLFLVATLLVLPSSFASARNGQTNLALAGLFLLLVPSLAAKRWWLAAWEFGLALVLKPIALAPLLLAAALHRRLLLPLVMVLLVLAAVPFLRPDPAYAWGEHLNFVRNLNQAGNPTGHTWCDFAGLLRHFGLDLPQAVEWSVRAGAGLLALVLGAVAVRRRGGLEAAWALLWLGMVYLMLFNPRTETNSYIMLGGFVAVAGGVAGIVRRDLKAAAWWVLMAFILGTENYGWPVFPLTNLWLKALSTLFLGWWLARALLGDRDLFTGRARSEACG